MKSNEQYLSRVDDILDHPEVASSIKTFMKIERTGRASVIKAMSFLCQSFPSIKMDHDTLIISMKLIRGEEHDMNEVIDFLLKEKKNFY